MKGKIIAGSAVKKFDFFIQWHLTERCNLRCRHCYQQGTDAEEMTPDRVKEEVDGATGMFRAWEENYGIQVTPSIHFTGGEPLLYPGMWDVAAYCRDKGYQVALLTNGCLITEEDSVKASSLGVSDIQISLEGPRQLHDDIRGKGSFASARRGLEKLLKRENRVSANVTLSRLNSDYIEKTVETARNTGFHRIGFSRVVPCGRGKAFLRYLLRPDELKEAYSRIQSLNSPAFPVSSLDPLAGTLHCDPAGSADALTLAGCSAGFSGVTVTSDGSVMPCRRIGLVAGNLKSNSLRFIWATSEILWRLRTRESYKGKCNRCGYWSSCRGCRAIAYHYSLADNGEGDLFADDPQCWHE